MVLPRNDRIPQENHSTRTTSSDGERSARATTRDFQDCCMAGLPSESIADRCEGDRNGAMPFGSDPISKRCAALLQSPRHSVTNISSLIDHVIRSCFSPTEAPVSGELRELDSHGNSIAIPRATSNFGGSGQTTRSQCESLTEAAKNRSEDELETPHLAPCNRGSPRSDHRSGIIPSRSMPDLVTQRVMNVALWCKAMQKEP